MMHWTVLLAVEEAAKEGGLFDIDATLPLMAVQFLILVAVLNVIFYKPLTKSIEERADYIRNTKVAAKERLAKAQQLAQQYEQKLGETRRESQKVIAVAQADAQKIAAAKVAEAQKEAQVARSKARCNAIARTRSGLPEPPNSREAIRAGAGQIVKLKSFRFWTKSKI
jgi:F-type H+-transporting ATPase subunit b